jgi:uncharacterized repeat protein (TIGR01451 family)
MHFQPWLVGVAAGVCLVVLGAGPAPASTSDPPALELHTRFVPPGFGTSGDPVTFQSTVTDVGASALTSLNVTGSLEAPTTCQTSTLTPGQSTICTSVYTATQSDVDAGQVTDTTTASALDPLGALVTSAESGDIAPGAGIPAMTLRVAIAPGHFVSVGDTITFGYTVANSGATTLHDLQLADDRLAPSLITCPATTLAPAAKTTCTATYAITAVDLRAAWITDTTTASALDPHDTPIASPPTTVTISGPPRPTLQLTVSTDASHVHAPGDRLRARYVITNTGPSTLAMIGLSDARIPPSHLICPTNTLTPGQSMICAGTIVTTTGDITRGHIRDNAAAWATEPLRGLVVTAPAVTFTATWPHPASTTTTTASPPPTAAGEPPTTDHTATPGDSRDTQHHNHAPRCRSPKRSRVTTSRQKASSTTRPRPRNPTSRLSGPEPVDSQRARSPRIHPKPCHIAGQPALPAHGTWRVNRSQAQTTHRRRTNTPLEQPRHKRPASARGPPKPAVAAPIPPGSAEA